MKQALHIAIFLFFSLQGLLPVKAFGQDEPQKVFTGIYLMNVYDLDVNEYSFYADFYLWFKWKGDRDPTNIEFVNSIEKWGFTQTMFHDTAQVLPDGYSYNGMRVEGRFYYSFALSRFPLDKHSLDIRLENVIYPIDSLVYVPDTSKVLQRKDLVIPGWNIAQSKISSHVNFYETAFGDSSERADRFSNCTFHLLISRPWSYFLLKLMLPLMVVIFASLGALFIHPVYIDARTSLPIGGLLSCVFLQQAYSSALPDVGYMVLMDKIYLLSYLLIAAVMLRVILAGNVLAFAGEGHSGGDLLRRDKVLAVVYFAVFIIGTFALVIFA